MRKPKVCGWRNFSLNLVSFLCVVCEHFCDNVLLNLPIKKWFVSEWLEEVKLVAVDLILQVCVVPYMLPYLKRINLQYMYIFIYFIYILYRL